MSPRARAEGLIVEPLGDEVLLYDQATDHAHALDAEASAVWHGCDGEHDATAIAAAAGLAVERVEAIIGELSALGLLADSGPAEPTTTRRQHLHLAALAVGGAVALPTVKSIVAPSVAQAATCIPSGLTCLASSQCCNGLCNGGVCA